MTRTDEIAARLAGARKLIATLNSGEARWTMHIPVQPHDSDVLLAAALDDMDALLAENARLRAVVKALTATVTRYETILHEETAAARELAVLLENAAPGDAGRLRAAEARLERAIAERERVNQ